MSGRHLDQRDTPGVRYLDDKAAARCASKRKYASGLGGAAAYIQIELLSRPQQLFEAESDYLSMKKAFPESWEMGYLSHILPFVSVAVMQWAAELTVVGGSRDILPFIPQAAPISHLLSSRRYRF